ncbi:MAG: hypothetical protein WD226_08485 [Planctomycetota bacterium]
MSELEQEYGEQVDFVIVPAEETALCGDDIEAFGFTELKHGLVIFDGEGRTAATLAGHQFGRAEIERALTGVLAP